jgi:hypothetical protein
MANPMMLTDMVTLYVKPSLGGQIIMRKPRTNQKSERVKIATACKGKKGRGFYGCLRTEGYRVFH